MILERFFDDRLAQTSYLIGCAATGEAVVVDPNRDADFYLAAAAAHGVSITHVTETHIHADFISGSRELAARTGATMYLSNEGGPDWSYAFAASDGAVLLRDGDTFRIGNIVIEAVHTPGHTPEHLSFLVTDTAAADRPIAILTGDFVFVGDVGRPDLLERAAGLEGTMEAGARTLYRSLRRFLEYPDYLQVLPGHGAGSACGKGISSVPASTVGYERLFNWGLQYDSEDAFVEAVLAGQPEPPRYFAMMKRINREGPPVRRGSDRPPRLADSGLADLLARGELVVDTRRAADYARMHVPGTINIPLNRSFSTWAGWLVPYDRDVWLVVEEGCDDCVDRAVSDLAMIGLDRVAGHFDGSAVQAWRDAGHPTGSTPRIGVADLEDRIREGDVVLIDVRGRSEWDAGHLPDAALHIPVGYLQDRVTEVPRDRPLVVYCQSGARSAIASSVLRRNGFDDVINLDGGIEAWQAAGRSVVSSSELVPVD